MNATNTGLAPADAPAAAPYDEDEDDLPREPLATGAAWCALGCVCASWAVVIGLVALARGCAS